MWLPRVMHVKTYLLNSICNIWTSESKILKSSCEAAKIWGVGYGITSGRELRIHINWSSTRLTVTHPSPFKYLNHVLLLR
jgi:hypothetical protein